jgi:Glycosyltransferase family 87
MYTFWVAYPETFIINPGINEEGENLAKDFSAFYSGAWRMLHNPSKVYIGRTIIEGEPLIYPQPEAYKYLPSFLLLISPLLALDYQQALIAFDVVQLALLPLMAFMLYKLIGKKGLIVAFALEVIALLLPFPMENWGVSVSYYWQWAEGQAKVLLTFLLILSFYLGYTRRHYLSGIVFAFGFFDPRFGLLALPLFVAYNRRNLLASIPTMIITLFISNSMLLFAGMGSSFINMVQASAVATPLYYYSLIPFLTMSAMNIVNARELVEVFAPPNSPLALKR